MKGRILEISDNLRNNKITELEAQNLLLGLFGVSSSALPDRPSGLEDSDWWCPNCKEVVEPHDVTNDERHGIENCMCEVN